MVGGLESVPDLKIKDAAKVFGKKFSSGASINETQTGEKEVVIQGDLSFDLPPLLISEFKVGLCSYNITSFLTMIVRSRPTVFSSWRTKAS